MRIGSGNTFPVSGCGYGCTSPTVDNPELFANWSAEAVDKVKTRIQESFGTSKSDEGFDASLDFDQDGEIGAGDFDSFVAITTYRSPYSSLEAITERFGATTGTDQYDSRADLDGDGEIGSNDYDLAVQAQNNGFSPLDAYRDIMEAMGNRSDGRSGVKPDFDFNHVVNTADLNLLNALLLAR